MKKIGIIGGIGPESTQMYYSEIINLYRERSRGQLPEIIIYSVNMEEMKRYLEVKDMNLLVAMLSEKVDKLVRAGADFVAMASNTPHIVYDELSRKSKVPMISIVDEAAKYCRSITKNKKVGLLGTGFTMKADFYPETFKKYNLCIVLPDGNEQEYIHEKIFAELALGIINEETKEKFIEIAGSMVKKYSIDTLVLGCTELPLIFDREHFKLHYVNTVTMHVKSIIDFCFQKR